MSAATQNEISFEQLRRFLLKIGFEQPARIENLLAFHHRDSDTVVTLPIPPDGQSVRPADLLSIRIRLENKGLVPEPILAQLKLGKLPSAP